MSALLRDLRAWLALSKAGRAWSKSLCASSAMAWVSSALTRASASSSSTTLCTCDKENYFSYAHEVMTKSYHDLELKYRQHQTGFWKFCDKTQTDLISLVLTYSQFLHEGIDISRFLFEDWLQSRKVHLHFVYKLIGLQQLSDTILYTIPGLYSNTRINNYHVWYNQHNNSWCITVTVKIKLTISTHHQLMYLAAIFPTQYQVTIHHQQHMWKIAHNCVDIPELTAVSCCQACWGRGW